LTLRADFAANGTLKITATAPNLCDPQPGVSMQDLHKVAAKVCGPKKDFVQKAAFSDPCKDKAQFAQYDDCKKKGIKIVVLDKQPLTYTFFIPAKDDNKEELVNISIDQIQLVKSRKGKGNGQKAQ